MANCENCYHSNCCKNYEPRATWACTEYKDNSLIIELPCKVGDTVYFISKIFNGKKSRLEISRRTITQIGGNKLNRIWFISDKPYEITFFPSEFGKNVFLTKEEAEKALSDKE